MGELPKLAELAASPAPRSFAAAVQHVAPDRRLRTGGRVARYHVVHLADPTRSFFKLLCWGDALPAFRREDHDGDDVAALRVGDIVLFSACTVKAFRGNVEAQFSRHSRAQLLYRRDRYFNTRDVRLKDLYPMIEWYKAQRHALFLVGDAQAPPPVGQDVAFTRVRDVREATLVNLRGAVRACRPRESALPAAHSSEFDGAQLYEVTLQDEDENDALGLNLWDQFAEPRFVARLVAHRGRVDVLGVVISFNSEARQLCANTTPRTTFRYTGATDTADSEGDAEDAALDRTFASVDALKRSFAHREGRAVLENVVVEHVLLGRFVGHADRVGATATPLLVECYCAMCSDALPLMGDDKNAPVCKSGCRVKPGETGRKWRYRSVQIVLRDATLGRITAVAGDAVLTRLLGNIDAELLVQPQERPEGKVLPFRPREAVANLLNSLVRGAPNGQLYRAELENSHSQQRADSHQVSLLSMNDSLRHDDESEREHHERFSLVSLTPVIEYPW